MMARKFPFSLILLLATVGSFLVGSLFLTMAGNKEMVDESIQELDQLNKQAVQQLPDLPQDGQVNLKAGVTYKDGSPIFDIKEQHVTSEKTETIHLDHEYTIDSEK